MRGWLNCVLISQQPQEEGSIALTDDEIADQVLGIKYGCVQGLGHGVAPPSGGLSGTNRMEVDELRRAEDTEFCSSKIARATRARDYDLHEKLNAKRQETEKQRTWNNCKMVMVFLSTLNQGDSGRSESTLVPVNLSLEI